MSTRPKGADFFHLLPVLSAKKAERLRDALRGFYGIEEIKDAISNEHTEKTPFRIVKAMLEMFEGCWEDPTEPLKTTFSEGEYDEIIYVNDLNFVSNCAHHNLSFFGKIHFGYLPDGKIVGLSKIPRFIRTLSRRPQVQEKLTREIIDTFENELQPRGCGVVIEAYHLCMALRGVEESPYTKTTALRGCFKTDESSKQEFLNGVRKTTSQIWP